VNYVITASGDRLYWTTIAKLSRQLGHDGYALAQLQSSTPANMLQIAQFWIGLEVEEPTPPLAIKLEQASIFNGEFRSFSDHTILS
jgi:hypothetical protein